MTICADARIGAHSSPNTRLHDVGNRPVAANAALKCLWLVTHSLDPTGKGLNRWIVRWKSVIDASAITFGDRWPSAEIYCRRQKRILNPDPDGATICNRLGGVVSV